MQQKQNIKGFTILELLVVLSIVGIVAGLGFPKFTKWNMDRLTRAQTEKIASIFTLASAQVERGIYPYVRIEFETNKLITAKGIDATTLSNNLNSGNPPSCKKTDMNGSEEISSLELHKNVYVFHLTTNAAVCFSKGGKYFAKLESAKSQLNVKLDNGATETNNVVVICHIRVEKCDPISKIFEPIQTPLKEGNFPVYLVKYSRFGIINKYKYSYAQDKWINQ